MYLSRLILNPRSRQVQAEIAHPYEMHRTVLRAFAEDLSQTEERVLFRLDVHPRTGLPTLLVQSQTGPDWSYLAAGSYLLPPDLLPPGEVNPGVKEVELAFRPGQMLAFRLLANPTKRLGKQAGPDKGKRVGLYRPEEQLAWLHRKGEQHGFQVLTAIPTAQRRTDDHRRQLKFLSVCFDGVLKVLEPERFLAAVHQGIGSGKAFGFGLLSLAPPR